MDTASRSDLRRALADNPAEPEMLCRLGLLLGLEAKQNPANGDDVVGGLRLIARAERVHRLNDTAYTNAAALLPPLWQVLSAAWGCGDIPRTIAVACLLLDLPVQLLARISHLQPLLDQISRIAATLHLQGDITAAKPLYRAYLAHVPGQPDVSHMLGAVEWRTGEAVRGIERIAAVVTDHPEMEGARHNLRIALDKAWDLAAEQDAAGQPGEAAAIRATLRHRTLLQDKNAFQEWGAVEFKGLHLRLPAGDFTYHACLLGRYEPHVMAAFLDDLRPGMTVVDVGANVGLFSLLAARAVGPAGHVFAIEALGRNAKIIRVNAELNGVENLTLIPIGLSDRTGSDLWIVQHQNTNNMLYDLAPVAGLPFDDFELIGVAPLDGLLSADTRVDVIKIDIEGREHKALQGAAAIITRDRPIIYSEYAPPYLRKTAGFDGRDYLLFVQSFGYGVEILHKDSPIEAVTGATPHDIAARVDAVYAEEEARNGTHLDLRFRPL